MFVVPRLQTMSAHGRKTDIARFQVFADRRMFFAESNHVPEEFKQVRIFVQQIPVQPGDLIILAVRIIITITSVAEFIAGEEHRGSTAAHEYGAGIFDHPEAQRENFPVVCIAFRTAVPAVVVVISVSIIPAVCLIMFLIIAVQVIEGKSVVTGQEVDGGIAAPVNRIVQIR